MVVSDEDEPGVWRRVRDPVPWYMLVAVVILPGVFSAVVLSISLNASQRAINAESQSRRQSELALCQVLSVWDDANRETPPTTERGRRIAEAIQNLMFANKCP